MLLVRLTVNETARALTRRRLWALVTIVTAAGVIMIILGARSPLGEVVEGQDGSRVAVYDYATSAAASHLSALSLMALVLPLALGDTLAGDRRSRYVLLLVSRGASRTMVIASRVAAGLASSAFSIAVVLTVWLCVAALVTPRLHGRVGAAVTHSGGLLEAHPALFFAAVVGVSALACGTLVACSHLLSVVVPSVPVTTLLPPLLLIMGVWIPALFPRAGAWASLSTTLNPATRVQFLGSTAPWASLGSTALYWSVLLGCVLFAGIAAYVRQESS